MWVSNQCCILEIIGRTKVKQMLCFDNSRIQGEDPSLFLIAPDVCGVLCLVSVFEMQYFMSFLVFFTVEERAGCFTLIVLGWSMVCDCGISSVFWPYTHCLAFLCYQ